MASEITRLRGEMAIATDAMEQATENWRRETMREIARLRAALETAEREQSALLAGKRWPAIERIKRDTEAQIVAYGKLIARSMMPNDGAAVLGFVRWIERGDHRKGADDDQV